MCLGTIGVGRTIRGMIGIHFGTAYETLGQVIAGFFFAVAVLYWLVMLLRAATNIKLLVHEFLRPPTNATLAAGFLAECFIVVTLFEWIAAATPVCLVSDLGGSEEGCAESSDRGSAIALGAVFFAAALAITVYQFAHMLLFWYTCWKYDTPPSPIYFPPTVSLPIVGLISPLMGLPTAVGELWFWIGVLLTAVELPWCLARVYGIERLQCVQQCRAVGRRLLRVPEMLSTEPTAEGAVAAAVATEVATDSAAEATDHVPAPRDPLLWACDRDRSNASGVMLPLPPPPSWMVAPNPSVGIMMAPLSFLGIVWFAMAGIDPAAREARYSATFNSLGFIAALTAGSQLVMLLTLLATLFRRRYVCGRFSPGLAAFTFPLVSTCATANGFYRLVRDEHGEALRDAGGVGADVLLALQAWSIFISIATVTNVVAINVSFICRLPGYLATEPLDARRREHINACCGCCTYCWGAPLKRSAVVHECVHCAERNIDARED